MSTMPAAALPMPSLEEQEGANREFHEAVDKVFTKLDVDKTGKLNAHELKQFFKVANHEHSLQRRKTAAELLK